MEIIKKFLPKKYRWMGSILKNIEKEDRSNFISGYKNRKKYYTNEKIEVNLKDLLRCANCPNMCRFDCPALQVTKRETLAPAHKSRISYFMGMEKIPWNNPEAIDTIYACMGCDACEQWCPMDISVGDLLFEMRAELEKRDLIPEKVQSLKTKIESTGSIFETSPFTADSDFNHNDPNPDVFYYIGCMDIKYHPNVIRATIALLEKLKVKFCTHLEERECCGGPIRKAGFKTVATKLSEKNQTLINGTKAKIAISNCPGCLETLAITYEDLGHPLKMKSMHTIDFFLDKIRQGVLTPSVPVKKVITYHDPCVLARKNNPLNAVEASRELLSYIPELKLKEAYLHGDETRCCGMGGAYGVSNRENSAILREERLVQLEKHNPDYIVSACPTCEYAFNKAQEQTKEYHEEIKDIIELLAESCGIKI
ncbi:MAG: (Fe-S)-binding protein [Promethearchaeota archaeon]